MIGINGSQIHTRNNLCIPQMCGGIIMDSCHVRQVINEDSKLSKTLLQPRSRKITQYALDVYFFP